jgi:hypothetical protein
MRLKLALLCPVLHVPAPLPLLLSEGLSLCWVLLGLLLLQQCLLTPAAVLV